MGHRLCCAAVWGCVSPYILHKEVITQVHTREKIALGRRLLTPHTHGRKVKALLP
jgi:hypothetical protein